MPSLESTGVTVERDQWCRTRDGTELAADVYRPEGVGDRPVLLYRIPYNKTAADSDVAWLHPTAFAREGFVVVVQDVRGRWASGGDFEPFRFEAEDGYDTIEWAASLPGSDGRVVTFGFSYPGLVQLLAAARRPPHLVAMAPAHTTAQAYEGWIYQRGALTGFAAEWAAYFAIDTARRAGDHESFRLLQRHLRLGATAFWTGFDGPVANALHRYAPYFDDWTSHPSDDDYWSAFRANLEGAAIDVPALHIGGWYDMFVRGNVSTFRTLRATAGSERARASQKLVIGPWTHMPWTPIAGAAGSGARELADLHLQFFRHHLYGEHPDFHVAPVRLYMLGDTWRDLDEWPDPPPQMLDLYLHSGGRAATRFGDGTLSEEPPTSEPADVVVYDPWMAEWRLDGGHGCCLPSLQPMGPACQCTGEEAPTVLVYTGAPTRRPLEIVGTVVLECFLASDAPDTDVVARLCRVDTDGCSTNLLEGIVRARYRLGTTTAVPLEPGRVERYEVDLGPIAIRLAEGEALRLDLSSSDFPQWDLNLNTGEAYSLERRSFGRVATQVFCHDSAHPARLRIPLAAD
jgi:putative CocE/NonD family hydrolase